MARYYRLESAWENPFECGSLWFVSGPWSPGSQGNSGFLPGICQEKGTNKYFSFECWQGWVWIDESVICVGDFGVRAHSGTPGRRKKLLSDGCEDRSTRVLNPKPTITRPKRSMIKHPQKRDTKKPLSDGCGNRS